MKNVRIHRIDKESILIVWNDFEYPNYERCIRTYQIWYAPLMSEASRIEPAKEDPQTSGWYWENLTPNGQLIPFLSYYHHVSPANPSVQGKIMPMKHKLHYALWNRCLSNTFLYFRILQNCSN